MANELRLNATIQYDDGVTEMVDQVSDRVASVGSESPFQRIQSIATSETAISLPSTPGVFMFRNMDPTNPIYIRRATGGANDYILRPDADSDGKGGFLVGEFSAITAPYAIATTAACLLKITAFPAQS